LVPPKSIGLYGTSLRICWHILGLEDGFSRTDENGVKRVVTLEFQASERVILCRWSVVLYAAGSCIVARAASGIFRGCAEFAELPPASPAVGGFPGENTMNVSDCTLSKRLVPVGFLLS